MCSIDQFGSPRVRLSLLRCLLTLIDLIDLTGGGGSRCLDGRVPAPAWLSYLPAPQQAPEEHGHVPDRLPQPLRQLRRGERFAGLAQGGEDGGATCAQLGAAAVARQLPAARRPVVAERQLRLRV